jgi:hypothetical protein
MASDTESPVSTEEIHTPQKRPSLVREKSGAGAKRKRICLTIGQKIEICRLKEANPSVKNNELASRYGVGEATISDILKKKEHLLSLQLNDYTASLRRERSSKYPEIEQALTIWIDQATDNNRTLSGHIVIAKAAAFAQQLDVNDFKGSQGWFNRFKKRHNVREYFRHGEANSAPLEDLPKHRSDLQELLSGWNLDDVYNCDETALYWKLEPSKTLARHPVAGTKKPKDRVTVLLTCNATGTSKLIPVFIHKFKDPRCMRNINRKDLPVYYYWNSSAWMQAGIFVHWLTKLNQDLRKQRRCILLLLDNATVHSLEEGVSFSNIKMHYLPKNTTAHLQPCDSGIIHSFKVRNSQTLNLKFVLLTSFLLVKI